MNKSKYAYAYTTISHYFKKYALNTGHTCTLYTLKYYDKQSNENFMLFVYCTMSFNLNNLYLNINFGGNSSCCVCVCSIQVYTRTFIIYYIVSMRKQRRLYEDEL